MERSHLGALAVSAALAAGTLAVGCGGDDDGSGEGGEASVATTEAAASGDSSGSGDCLEAWNADADDTLKGVASLSNAPDAEVDVGPYAGEPFSSEAFDGGTSGTGQQVEVKAGDCVVSEFSQDFGLPLFVFVRGSAGDGAATWHRISESGKHPLNGDAASLIDPVTTATLTDDGELEPAGG